MQRFQFQSLRNADRKRRNIIFLLSALGVVLLISISVGIFYGVKKKNDVQLADDDIVVTSVCAYIPDDEKLDCYADASALVDEDACVGRRCCYSGPKNVSFSSSPSTLDVPSCYYPSNYSGYSIQSVKESPSSKRIKLKRVQPSGFPKDILNVDILVYYIDDNSLRIKITDADSQRYEVPTQLYYQTTEIVNPKYKVNVDSKSGYLTVLRSGTNSVVFRTNLFRLVFSDQFLQLSSDLPSSVVYGIGEHYESVLRSTNWTRFTLLNSDLSPIPNHALYGSHPFYIALEKDGKANGVFLHNSNIMDVILQPAPAITFRPIGGIFDFYVMLGPSPKDVSQQYSNIVGKTFMPPFWSLGFQLCRWGYDSLEETKKAMDRTIAAGIPLDVQWNDIDYMDKYKDFTYDKDKFAGLPKFVEDLHSKGMHYVLMIDPGISNSEESYIPYDEGVDDDIFVKHDNGSMLVGKVWTAGTTVYPDFSHPASISYWTRQFQRLYDEIKYDGVWIDMNEPSNFVNGAVDGCPDSPLENPPYVPGGNALTTKTLCMSAKHYHSTHYNEHNLYAYRETVATNAALRSVRKKRPFIISRDSYSGQGVFGGHWSGDIFSSWEDLRYSVRSLINFNIYAMPMIGSDICGFNGETTIELCARWHAVGAFYPFSRNHNTEGAKEQDPVAMGPLVTQTALISLSKRYTLLPSLYTLFYKSHVFGDTVIRPLFFEFPEDKNTYSIDEQFLWGSNIMIVPVLYENTDTVDAYFPEGVWYNAVTAEKNISSGERIKLTIPTNDIYISIRGGTIMASLLPGSTTSETRNNPFTIAVALDSEGKANGELYWDDGDSLETFENGLYNLIKFEANNGVLTNEVVNNGYESSMLMQGISIAGFPTQVSVNGHQCNYSLAEDTVKNSTINVEDVNGAPSIPTTGIFGVGAVKFNLAEDDDAFCTFFQIASMCIVQTKPISLLSPLTVTWK